MTPYKTKSGLLPGSNLGEVYRSAWAVFHKIESKTKRKPYLRSAYFSKEKIFFDFFWNHLKQKSPRERFRRLKFFKASFEVIKHSKNMPTIKGSPDKKSEILYRFAGMTKGGELFIVQVKENKNSKRKYLMSCFPVE